MNRRILILAEGKFSPLKSKTANGAIAYLREQVTAVIDSTKAGMTAQQVLGYGGAIPVLKTLEEGLQTSPTHLLIGIAPPGGRLPETWRDMIRQTLKARVHILNGLHTLLTDDPEFVGLAAANGVAITDYRKIPDEYQRVSTGLWRQRKPKVILAVGTDCNIGKMTTLLQLNKELNARGVKSDFVATGQTGILIRERGIAVDAVISDYIAGSIELEIEKTAAEGPDYILVEGQGSITHMGYSGVTLGLMHGSMPDAMILCHQPTRLVDDFGIPLMDLRASIALHESLIAPFKPCRVIGIGLNSIGLTDRESEEAARDITRTTGLPAIDTFRFGAAPLAEAVLNQLPLAGPAGTGESVATHSLS